MPLPQSRPLSQLPPAPEHPLVHHLWVEAGTVLARAEPGGVPIGLTYWMVGLETMSSDGTTPFQKPRIPC